MDDRGKSVLVKLDQIPFIGEERAALGDLTRLHIGIKAAITGGPEVPE
jgi:hypothetical protein